MCNKNIHKRCSLDSFGCKKCRDDMFPASCDIFSSGVNNKFFDPYNPDSLVNLIGSNDDIEAESEILDSLSKNLRKCKYTFLEDLNQSNNNKFNILSLNIQSLKGNFHKLIEEIEQLQKFDAICLCETNIDPSESTMGNHDLYNLEGFNAPIIQKPARMSNKGGGLAIYINSNKFNDESIKIIENISTAESPESGEFLFLEIDTGPKNKNIILGNMYRSPSHKPQNFIDKLSEICINLDKNMHKNIILVGDTNVDLIQHDTNTHTQNYFNCMSQHGFIPVISRPTRITDHSMTLIDHVFTNSLSNFLKSGILKDHFADHLGVFINISLNNLISPQSNGNYFFTDFSEANATKFEDLVNKANWQTVADATNANDKYNVFLEMYEKCYTTAFPTKTKKVKNPRGTGKPWMMEWLKEACDRKNRLYCNFINHPTTENKQNYTKYKKWTEKQIYKAKRKYYSNQITKCNTNAKKQWKLMNEIINRRKTNSKITKLKINDKDISNGSQISNHFNTYFCNIASKLKGELRMNSEISNDDNPLQYLKVCSCTADCTCTRSSIFLEPCTEAEIISIISELNNTSTADFNTKVLKSIKNIIAPIVTLLINASLEQGIFPSALKIAKVIPIFKSGKRNDVSNYRPISLLSVFSKIYEKIMYRRIISFLNNNKLINNRQYGFRAAHSCEHALLDAQSVLTRTLDNKETALLLLIDFSKAFDMVDHSLILQKLNYYGIRGIAHEWFKSYLTGRKQYVCVNCKTSNIDNLSHGVPQGSILGPLLFLIFINDLPNIFPVAHFVLYADDANIIVTGKTVEEIENKIKFLIPALTKWVGLNSLKLNTTKTKYMLISNTINHDFNIVIHNQQISRVKEEKFLGVLIDDKLSFNSHRVALAKKVANNCGVLFRARHMLNKKSLAALYYSFIQSHMIYCVSVWGLGNKTSINSIFVSQKKALRAISFTKLYKKDKVTGVYTYGHTKKIFKEYGFQTIHNLILMQVLNLMHKIKLAIVPEQIIKLFTIRSNSLNTYNPLNEHQQKRLARLNISINNVIGHDHNWGITKIFNEPCGRLKTINSTISILGPKVYNHFVSQINSQSVRLNSKATIKHENLGLTAFKSRMKAYILKIQSDGDGIYWSNTNSPLYTFTNRETVLRSDLRT